MNETNSYPGVNKESFTIEISKDFFVKLGWQCPLCGVVYSPDVLSCDKHQFNPIIYPTYPIYPIYPNPYYPYNPYPPQYPIIYCTNVDNNSSKT